VKVDSKIFRKDRMKRGLGCVSSDGRKWIVMFRGYIYRGCRFWSRPPTGREWLAQALLSINHGARGTVNDLFIFQ
jgi:hypothetical protein